jgi:hypothetical protein
MVAEEAQKNVIHLFYSYAHSDISLRNELEKHLSLLRQQGHIAQWYDRDISAGMGWRDQINSNLERADIVLLLISADFLASEYCYSSEMKHALKRHDAGSARVIPVLLRPVDWQEAPFALLQMLPRNGKAITTWKNRDLAFEEIAIDIRAVVTELHKNKGSTTRTMVSDLFQTSRGDSPGQKKTPEEREDTEPVPTVYRRLFLAVDHLRQYHKKVSELKSVHNMLHEIERQLEGLTSMIQFQLLPYVIKEARSTPKWLFTKKEPASVSIDITIVAAVWPQVRQKIDDLKYFATIEMEALDEEHFRLNSDTMHGPLWITELFELQIAFEGSMQEQDMKKMSDHAQTLLRISRSHLFLIDKQLLKAIKELEAASERILRNIP